MAVPRIAIIGAGAAGSLFAAHLTASATRSGTACELVVIEPRPGIGRGTAFGTRDRRHRLNVPADKMSAWPDDPEHFLDWLRTHAAPDSGPGDFAARSDYGRYLTDVLDDALAAADGKVRLQRLYERVTGLRPYGTRLRLRIGTRPALAVDAAVLATGNAAPDIGWAPEELTRSGRLVADPWAVGALDRLRDIPGEVLLVGSGLTMVDVALSLAAPDRQLHAISRHGLLPTSHRLPTGLPSCPPPVIPDDRPKTLVEIRRIIEAHVTEYAAAHGDWRPAFDSLRPITSSLWQMLSEVERGEFLVRDVRRWDVHRHRTSPDVGDWLRARVNDESLRLHTGKVLAAHDMLDRVEVTLSSGATVSVGAVVACTGPASDVRTLDDPLMLDLLASGTARPGSQAMGLDTDGQGRLITADGVPLRAVYAIGSLRRGQLWESTAVPEICEQAAALAHDVLAGLPPQRIKRRPRDPYGLALSTSPAAAEAYTEALGAVLRVQEGAEVALRRALALDPEFALGHATLALLGEEWNADVDIPGELALAQQFSRRWGDERERSVIAAMTERILQPGPAAVSHLLAHIQAFPEDALAVSMAVPTIAFSGAMEVPAEAWALVEGLAPAYGEDWWYVGMLAFVRQEQERWIEADRLSEWALSREPGSGHAVHARTHVFYETGDHEAGLDFLDGWIAGCGQLSSHRAHFSWHAALHELALGDDEAVRRRYREQLAPDQVQGVRALVDSASILWRCALTNRWDGAVPVADVLAVVDDDLLDRPTTAFTGMHSAIALAAAGDGDRLRRLSAYAGTAAHPVLSGTIAPLAECLALLVSGRSKAATEALVGLNGVLRIGGSAAQREVVEDTLLAASLAAGRTDITRAVLDRRLDRRPSPADRALLRTLPKQTSSNRTRGVDSSGRVRRFG